MHAHAQYIRVHKNKHALSLCIHTYTPAGEGRSRNNVGNLFTVHTQIHTQVRGESIKQCWHMGQLARTHTHAHTHMHTHAHTVYTHIHKYTRTLMLHTHILTHR